MLIYNILLLKLILSTNNKNYKFINQTQALLDIIMIFISLNTRKLGYLKKEREIDNFNYYFSLTPFRKFPVVIPPVDMLLIFDLSWFIFFMVLISFSI